MRNDPVIRDWKTYAEDGRKYRIRAYGGLHKLRGNQRPYFSLTGSTEEWRHGAWADGSGGCIHDELLKHWPELKLLALLHLADDEGAPMHAAGNGLYWLWGSVPEFHDATEYHGGTGTSAKPTERCQEILRDHLRISDTELVPLLADMKAVAASLSHYARVWERGHYPAVKAAFTAYCEAQRPRWKREAEKAITVFNLQRYGDL